MASSSNEVEVIGHKGGGGAPGNTMAAIQQGLDAGADVIEIDVHLTACGHLIMCHGMSDESVDVNGSQVSDQTLSKLKDQYPQKYLPEAFHDEEVLQLRNLLVNELTEVPLILDVKNCLLPPDRSDQLLDAVLDLFDLEERNEEVCIASFDHKFLSKLKNERPNVQVGLISGSNSLHQKVDLDRLEPDLWLLHWRYAGTPAVHMAEDHGTRVYTWVLNRDTLVRKAMTAGVHGVITDHPKRVREAITSFQSS